MLCHLLVMCSFGCSTIRLVFWFKTVWPSLRVLRLVWCVLIDWLSSSVMLRCWSNVVSYRRSSVRWLHPTGVVCALRSSHLRSSVRAIVWVWELCVHVCQCGYACAFGTVVDTLAIFDVIEIPWTISESRVCNLWTRQMPRDYQLYALDSVNIIRVRICPGCSSTRPRTWVARVATIFHNQLDYRKKMHSRPDANPGRSGGRHISLRARHTIKMHFPPGREPRSLGWQPHVLTSWTAKLQPGLCTNPNRSGDNCSS